MRKVRHRESMWFPWNKWRHTMGNRKKYVYSTKGRTGTNTEGAKAGGYSNGFQIGAAFTYYICILCAQIFVIIFI